MIKVLDGKGRAERSRYLLLVSMVGAIGGIAVALTAIRMNSGLLSLAISAAGFGLSLVSLLASQRWWREADEAVKEAHKTGWYWGSTGGLALSGGILAFLFAMDPDISLRSIALLPGDSGLVATGVAAVMVLAFLGYLVGWAAWWLSRGR
jgi:hypothetical protein